MFAMDPPQFAHLPLMLNQKGQKLSKRFNDVSVTSYMEKGFLPEALLNGVALMGWNPPHREDPTVLAENTGVFLRHEVLRLDDMIVQFNLDKISKSGAKFDLDKL
jgi:glutamyl/glutaminyl-tRNA synthetase